MKKKRNKIGYCLKLIGKKQNELAKFVEVTPMCVSRWCHGINNPYPKYMEKILLFLNINKPANLPVFTEDDIVYLG